MMKGIIFLLCFFLSTLLIFPVFAEMRIASLDVSVTKNDGVLVTYLWKVAVASDEDGDGCSLFLSFRDGQGRQIHLMAEPVSLTAGTNHFQGTNGCDSNTWKLVKDYKARISCR